MNILDKIYKHDLDMNNLLATKEALRKLLIKEYGNLVDAPDELTDILEKTTKCLEVYKHLNDNIKFPDSQYTDSKFEGGLKETLNQIDYVLTAKDSANFLSDPWYAKKEGRELLEKLNEIAKDIQTKFVIPVK